MRKPVIGVMGGASVSKSFEAMADQLGALIAGEGWILLNGGRQCGVMAASARGAKRAGGLVIGILQCETADGSSPDLDVAIVTGMGDARNVINVLSSTVVIALPGGAGTLSEIALALKANRPVVLLGSEIPPSLSPYRAKGLLHHASTPEEAVGLTRALLAG